MSQPPELTNPRLQPYPLLSGFWASAPSPNPLQEVPGGLLAKQGQAQKPAQGAPSPTVPSPKGRALPCSEGLSPHSGLGTPWVSVQCPIQPSLPRACAHTNHPSPAAVGLPGADLRDRSHCDPPSVMSQPPEPHHPADESQSPPHPLSASSGHHHPKYKTLGRSSWGSPDKVGSPSHPDGHSLAGLCSMEGQETPKIPRDTKSPLRPHPCSSVQ